MDLRCRKTTCKYNKNLTCMAEKLSISNKLVCENFLLDKTKQEQDFSKQIFSSTPPEISNYRPLKDMNLSCNANCLFNNNGQCLANGITINSTSSKKPKCITFMKP